MGAGQNDSNKVKKSKEEEPSVCQKTLKKAGHIYWVQEVSQSQIFDWAPKSLVHSVFWPRTAHLDIQILTESNQSVHLVFMCHLGAVLSEIVYVKQD